MNRRLKDLVRQVPAAAMVYDAIRPRRPRTRYNLEQLAGRLNGAIADVRPYLELRQTGRKLVLFATLHYWIEQAVIVGLALRAMGHDVTVAYLPYSNWDKDINPFDLSRQDLYTRRTLRAAEAILHVAPLRDEREYMDLPPELEHAVLRGSEYDSMYTLQTETVDRGSTLFQLRQQRNRFACAAVLSLLSRIEPDAAIIPNGLVTELGILYQAARHLRLPTVTYEFNDQREQVWLAHNGIVMHQDTDALWAARGRVALTEAQQQRIEDFEGARQGARTYGKGTRLWQDTPAQGQEHLRAALGLDGRPIVLLATNVLGDSLTLGRNLFASSMAEWIQRTALYFAQRPDVQLVVRIHPGERLIKGPSIARVIEDVIPDLPRHIRVIHAAETVNTYDVMGISALGLVYTTTVGMEMAMRGVPVITAGNTHYRDRGFVMAPTSWEEYFGMLDRVLKDPSSYRLSERAIELAWRYGYYFFFEYPFDFPWRLMHFWKDFGDWPLRRVLSDEGMGLFGRTFRYLAGEEIDWSTPRSQS